jgi:Tfp pilus assembly protein PilP
MKGAFSIKEALSFGWQTSKGNLLFFLKLQIIAFLALVALGLLSGALQFAGAFGKGGVNVAFGIISLLVSILSSAASSLIYIGFTKISLRFCDGENPEVKDLFIHYNLLLKYFGASLLLAAIMAGAVGLMFVGIASASLGSLRAAPMLIGIALAIAVALSFMFFSYAVVDRGAGPLNALRFSYLITKGAKLKLFLFILAAMGINILGSLLLMVGLLVTIPLTLVAVAHVYRRLVSRAEASSVDLSAKSIKENTALIAVIVISAAIMAAAVFLAYRSTLGSNVGKEAAQYADNVFMNMFGKWDADRLLAEASPEYFSTMPREQGAATTKNLFRDASEKLGRLQKYAIASQNMRTSKSPDGKTVTFMEYTANSSFEKGNAQIILTLIRKDDKWKVYGFRWSLPSAAQSQPQAAARQQQAQPQAKQPQQPQTQPPKPAEPAKPDQPKAKPAETPQPPNGGKQEIKEAPKPSITMAGYEYSALGRRDPFMPLIVKQEAKPKKSQIPVENFEVADFRLIAILWKKDGYYAVISLPDGKSYTIREGMRLGLHGGKVYKISKDSVIIRENIRDYKGVVSPKDTVLKLRKEEG